MPTHTSQRAATPDELAAVKTLLADSPTTATRLKRGAGNALVLWAASLLGVVVIWLVVGWIAGKALGTNLGLRSSATFWLVAVATPVCAVLAVISSSKWVHNWTDYRPLLRDDVAQSRVTEERYVFTEARRFQDPEHGGLMYFLRSAENEVFTLFDYESHTLGVDDKDPLGSRYRPQSNLLIVRAPHSGFVLSKQSSGSELSVGPPIELAVDPKEWPEPETLCRIPWSQLEERLGSKAAVSGERGDA